MSAQMRDTRVGVFLTNDMSEADRLALTAGLVFRVDFLGAPMTPELLQEMTVNAIIERHPETVRVFAALGIDACCGGARILRDVAYRHRLDTDALLGAVRAAIVPSELRTSASRGCLIDGAPAPDGGSVSTDRTLFS